MRGFTAVLLALAAVLALPPAELHAQAYPIRTIHVIVPFAPGGGTDSVTRIVLPALQEALGGANIVIENRPGAGTIIGATAVARSAPDGYTLMVTLDQTVTMNQFLYDNLPYDPQRDFVPVSLLAVGPLVYVANPKVPAKSLKELIAYAKANPGKLNYGSGAIGGRVAGEHLMDVTNTKMVFIPYTSGSQALTALLANDVQFVIADMGTFGPPVADGRVTGLAVSGPTRSPLLPEVPTLRELGFPQIEAATWWAMYAPAGTPKAIVDRLNAAIAKAITDPNVRQRIGTMGNEPRASSPEEVTAMLKHDVARWGPVIKKAGIKLN